MSDPLSVDTGVSEQESERRTATRSVLSVALAKCRASLLGPDGENPETQHRSITALVLAVRKLDEPPERFLALFKNMAGSAAPIARLPAHERMAAMQRLTTIAIETYYQSDNVDADKSAVKAKPGGEQTPPSARKLP